MAYALVVFRSRIIEVFDVLFFDEVAQDVHISLALLVLGEDVMIGNNHDLLGVEDLGLRAELLFENAYGTWAADIVGHQNVHVGPDDLAGV